MNGSTTVDALVIGGGATGAGLLRDLSRRGLKTLLVEKSDLGTGTSGRYHGLLHSGGRYVVTDPAAAHECAVENAIVRRIAPACVEDTGGYFVATPEDPDDFGDGFAAACAASSVPVDEVSTAAVRAREPALNPALKRAFRVRDGVVEPWQLDRGERRRRPLPWRRRVAVPPGRRDAAVRRPDPRGRRRRRAHGNPPHRPSPDRRQRRRRVGGPGGGARRRRPRDVARQGHDADLQPADDRHRRQPPQATGRRRHHGPGPQRRDPRHDRGGGRRPGRLRDPARGGRGAPRRGREALPGPAADAAPAGVCRRPAAVLGRAVGRGGGRRPGDLAGPRRDRPRGARRRRQPRLDRRRQADDLPAHGEADRRCRRPQARAAGALHDRRGGPARPGRRADVLAGPPARGARGRRRWRR